MYIETIPSWNKGPHFVGSVCVHSIESMFCRNSQSLRTNLREHAGCRIIHPRGRTPHLMQQAHTENRVHALWNLSEAAYEFQRSQVWTASWSFNSLAGGRKASDEWWALEVNAYRLNQDLSPGESPQWAHVSFSQRLRCHYPKHGRKLLVSYSCTR